MNLLDRLLAHDAWTTGQILDICSELKNEQLDYEFDIGHRTIRKTLQHLIHNMETWSGLMLKENPATKTDTTISGMQARLTIAAENLRQISERVAESNAWDTKWIDQLDNPPQEKSYGTAIAHVITHSMHHRAQLLYMLRLTGMQNLPEGDVFSWENAAIQ